MLIFLFVDEPIQDLSASRIAQLHNWKILTEINKHHNVQQWTLTIII